MKILRVLLIILVLPTFIFAQDKIGNTSANGITIPVQTSNSALMTRELIQQFFIWLNNASKSSKPISKEEMLEHFDSHVIYIVNGKTLAYTLARLLARFNHLKKMYKSISIEVPVKIITVAGNHVATHYQINIVNKDKQHYQDDVGVLITLKDRKITTWRAVVAHHAYH